MDLLTCAKGFQKLFETQYTIVIGKKGKKTTLKIEFSKKQFHHLLGVHKLKDLEIARYSSTKVFNHIIEKRITIEDLQKSQYYKQIHGRIKYIEKLEDILDSDTSVFKLLTNVAFTKIQADFILQIEFDNRILYVFLKQDTLSKIYFCCSFFPFSGIDYCAGQPRYCILEKVKHNKASV